MKLSLKYCSFVSLCLCLFASPLRVVANGEPVKKHVEVVLERFSAPEARQGVAVDDDYVYVVSNRWIGKYDKKTHEKVAEWKGPEDGPIIHLNQGIILDGKLYCAHSNYPAVPMAGSIEIWDPDTLEHIGNRSFGILAGSTTWIDRKNGYWYVCFAHYDNRAAEPNRNPRWTTVIKFDDEGRRLEGWIFPDDLLERFHNYSCSGGAFGPDGRLYVTGHDNTELYVLEFPEYGSTFKWVDTIAIQAEGQAISFDKSDPGVMYSVLKKNREVIKSRITGLDGS